MDSQSERSREESLTDTLSSPPPRSSSEILLLLTTYRSSSLLSSFLSTLTTGTATTRPIELNAHDPLRYLGDMLAWLHQCIASEREFLESLFGVVSKREMGSVRVFKGEGEGRVRELLDGCLEGCGRPLKVCGVRDLISSLFWRFFLNDWSAERSPNYSLTRIVLLSSRFECNKRLNLKKGTVSCCIKLRL